MPDVLTPPLALAALVLCVAGAHKLRSPAGAAGALASIGAPVAPLVVRGFALLELALGAWCLGRPSAVSDAVLGSLYLGFSGLVLLLARRRSPCGCFSARREPASGVQSLLSAALAAVAIAAAIWGPHGVPWLLARPTTTAAVLIVGLAGGVYATVVAYTELPLAWSAWTGGSR